MSDNSSEITNYGEALAFIEAQGCNVTCDSNNTNPDDRPTEANVVTLQFLTHEIAAGFMEPIAKKYLESRSDVTVNVTFVKVDFRQLAADIINEAANGLQLYDGFVTPPTVSGSVVEYGGWADFTSYIQASPARLADWSDILIGYRKKIAQYENQNILFPLDGDILGLYYRADVLEAFGLQVPRTWDEYNEVAKAVHGKEFEGKKLSGSCIGRVADCAGAYWANLLIAAQTQSGGQSTGHLFDTKDMTPLTGPALVQALEWMEGQVLYGAEDEFKQCFGINIAEMNAGNCTLTYNWGNSFKEYLSEGSVLAGGKFGVAPTPGSKKVLDRVTKQLVDCDENSCRYGKYYDDIGWVNQAPYTAFGGWSCAVNSFSEPVKRDLAIQFCAYAASAAVSTDAIIPFANDTNGNGQDPYRWSQINEEAGRLYVERGYEEGPVKSFLDSIRDGLSSENVVTDIRFPQASVINSRLDFAFYDHLIAVKQGLIPDSQREARRQQVAQNITNQWTTIINDYNALGSTRVPILEAYQRLRGVYSPDVNMNQLSSIRPYGYVLLGIIYALAIISTVWTIVYRKEHIVRASQPFFLVMICMGAVVLGTAIIPFSIDDSNASPEGCNKACVAIPWLIATGWTILFSALFAKIWRVNIVYRNSIKFRRLKVSETDVLLPFAILLTLNVIILLVWTLMDPLYYSRTNVSVTDSYGSCSASGDVIWKICISLLAALNGTALLMANFQAWQARNLSTEYGESKYIGMAMACILQVIVVGVPLLFLVYENPPADYFVRSTIVFVICASILLLIFGPKMYHHRKRKGGSSHSLSSRSVGLTYRVLEKETLIAQEAKYQAFKKKVTSLKELMESKGIDANSMINQVGLGDDLKHSTVVLDSQVSMRESYAPPTGAISSIAESSMEDEDKRRRSVASSDGLSTDDDHKMVNFIARNGIVDEDSDEDQTESHHGAVEGGEVDNPDVVSAKVTISNSDETDHT